MVEVYYYVPLNSIEDALDCGLKLSRWFDREVFIGGTYKKCIATLLNPKDDMEKYRSQDYVCVKLQLLPYNCFVADRYLYIAGRNHPEIMKEYTRTIVPVEKYIFGSCRLPECLAASTVIAEQISLLDRRIDSPVIFDNSEELYVNNIIELLKEKESDIGNTFLYLLYCKLAEIRKADKIEDTGIRIAVFTDKKEGRKYIFKIPDMNSF